MKRETLKLRQRKPPKRVTSRASTKKGGPLPGQTGPEDFRRRFMVHVCKDGTVTYRDAVAREPVFNGVALPVISVDTVEQAEALQVRFCRRQYGEHPQMPGKPWYRLSRLGDGTDPAERPSGLLEIDDLPGIGAMFKVFLQEQYHDRRT